MDLEYENTKNIKEKSTIDNRINWLKNKLVEDFQLLKFDKHIHNGFETEFFIYNVEKQIIPRIEEQLS